jgi:hypothetical protein
MAQGRFGGRNDNKYPRNLKNLGRGARAINWDMAPAAVNL